jgi:hypothetical protein
MRFAHAPPRRRAGNESVNGRQVVSPVCLIRLAAYYLLLFQKTQRIGRTAAQAVPAALRTAPTGAQNGQFIRAALRINKPDP